MDQALAASMVRPQLPESLDTGCRDHYYLPVATWMENSFQGHYPWCLGDKHRVVRHECPKLGFHGLNKNTMGRTESKTGNHYWNYIPKEGSPVGQGRFSLSGNGDGYIGNVVSGSISHKDTLGCRSPAVDSSQPTCINQFIRVMFWLMEEKLENWLRPHQSKLKLYNSSSVNCVTNLDRAPMWVLPSYRIQVTNASDCAHVAVYTIKILGTYELASNSISRNLYTQLKKLKSIKKWVTLKPNCNN